MIQTPRPGGAAVVMGEGGETELAAPVKGMLREMTRTAMAAGGARQIVIPISIGGRAVEQIVIDIVNDASSDGRVRVSQRSVAASRTQ